MHPMLAPMLLWATLAAPFGPDDPPELRDFDAAADAIDEAIARGELAGAGRRLRELLDAIGPAGGREEPTRIWCLEMLGYVSLLDQRPDDAIGPLEEAVAANAAHYGARHPRTAYALLQRASAHEHGERFDDAERDYRRALAMLEDSFGDDHPAVAEALGGLGSVLASAGRLDEAARLLERGLTILEGQAGPDDRRIPELLNQLAWIRKEEGDPGEAERLMQRAVELASREDAAGSPRDLIGYLGNLADVLEDRRAFDESVPHRRRALELAEAAFGPEHPTSLYAACYLGRALGISGSYLKAQEVYILAVDRFEAAGSDDTGLLIAIIGGLGTNSCVLERYDDAERHYRRAIDLKEDHYGPEHPEVAETLHWLATLCEKRGHDQEADTYRARAADILERAGSPSDDTDPDDDNDPGPRP